MTVFKTVFKIVKKYKFIIILYTVLLITFAGINMQTSDNSTNFVASKPDIYIINEDEEIGITKSLVEYMRKNNNIIEAPNDKEDISDALFYRDVNYIIYIPENYNKDFFDKKNPEIKVESTGDYNASLAEMMLSRFLEISNTYLNSLENKDEIIANINETLEKEINVDVMSKLDTYGLSRATFYYNFLNYSILAGLVYVICIILSSFREENIRKRTIVSSMDYKKYNINLLIANSFLAIILWSLYVILSFILIGNIMFSYHGLILIINSFIFTICALTIAFLIGNLVNNKNAINGIVNVIGLGTSFLCGAFVPVEWLPDTILKIAHILPSYWYIRTNELVKTLEKIDFYALKNVFINMGIILLFSISFVIITNIITSKKRKIS